MRGLLACCLLLFSTSVGLAQNGKTQLQTRSYNVDFLNSSARNQPPIGLGFSGSGDRYDSSDEDGEDGLLVNLIATSIDPGSWDSNGWTIEIESGALLVTCPAKTHRGVAAMLTHLRYLKSRQLRLELTRYAASRELIARLVDKGPVLDAEHALLLTQAKRLSRSSLIAFSGQRVTASRTRLLRYVKDIELEVAQSQRVADPELGRFRLGHSYSLRPILSNHGHGVLVDLTLRSARLIKRHKFITGPRYQMPLEQPEVEQSEISTTLWTALDKPVLVAAGPGTQAGMELFVLRVSKLTLWTPKLPKLVYSGKRRMAVFDIRFMQHQPDAPRSHWLGEQAYPSGGMGVAASFDGEPAESGVLLSDALLQRMVRNRIDEDSWHNSRNKISALGGRMTSTQKPEVLKAIATLVGQLETARARQLLYEIDVVTLAGDARLPRVGETVQGKGLAAMLQSPRSSWLVTALAKQTVQLARFRERGIVTDYDAEIAQNSAGQDPGISQYREGTALTLDAKLIGSGGGVLLGVHLRRAKVRYREKLLLRPFTYLQRPTWYWLMPLRNYETRYSERLMIQQAAVSRTPIRLRLALPTGKRLVTRAEGREIVLVKVSG